MRTQLKFVSYPLDIEVIRMFVRLVKFIYMLALLQCISAHIALMPRFYGQDSAIIVDTDKQKYNPKLQNALYYNLPVYKLINPASVPKASTTTTTTVKPALNEEEYPSDLLYIARNKLGLKRTDQLPSISELGELLGSGSAADTVKYIRTLTSNDQGLALMKAYLGSIDYESETDTDYVSQPRDNEDNNAANNADMDADYEDVPPIKQPNLETTSTTKAPLSELEAGSLMQRVNDFMKQYSLWSDSSTTPKPITYQPVFVPPVRPVQPASKAMRPLLVRQPLPYHYPIPVRPVLLTQTVKTTPMPAIIPSTTAVPNLSTQASLPPHLNTPKKSALSGALVAPHIQQLAEIANIPPQVLDQFLQQQPKLAALAQRVSRLPLVQQHSRAIDSQLLMAVKKALTQDESLKRLLEAAETLK